MLSSIHSCIHHQAYKRRRCHHYYYYYCYYLMMANNNMEIDEIKTFKWIWLHFSCVHVLLRHKAVVIIIIVMIAAAVVVVMLSPPLLCLMMNTRMDRGKHNNNNPLHSEHTFACILWILFLGMMMDTIIGWCATGSTRSSLETIWSLSLPVFDYKRYWMHEWIEQTNQ